jgi:hypothetical protein
MGMKKIRARTLWCDPGGDEEDPRKEAENCDYL